MEDVKFIRFGASLIPITETPSQPVNTTHATRVRKARKRNRAPDLRKRGRYGSKGGHFANGSGDV